MSDFLNLRFSVPTDRNQQPYESLPNIHDPFPFVNTSRHRRHFLEGRKINRKIRIFPANDPDICIIANHQGRFMVKRNWTEQLGAAITVCDASGIILEMNDKAAKTFADEGGKTLIGKNLFDCHNVNSCAKLKQMIEANSANCYTIEKAGVKKLIYQAPWFENGQSQGLVEISIEIPFDMPHFNRDKPSPAQA
jgi:transcriptional regulator with PAS, ATPase and Fis domain